MTFIQLVKIVLLKMRLNENNENLDEIEKKIIKILDQKIRPAVAKDGGDIKFKEFKNGDSKSTTYKELFWMSKLHNDT